MEKKEERADKWNRGDKREGGKTAAATNVSFNHRWRPRLCLATPGNWLPPLPFVYMSSPVFIFACRTWLTFCSSTVTT
jgi:hypothetical protein